MSVQSEDWNTRVWSILGEVVDPCSCLASMPVSIVELGLVEKVDVSENEITVNMLLTDPMCMYFIDMADEVKRRVTEGGWSGEVRVNYDTDGSWDTGRISRRAQQRFDDRRAQRVVDLQIAPFDYSVSTQGR